MFRPDLRGLHKAINITGDPEPRPQGRGPGSTDDSRAPADQLAYALDQLRFGKAG